MVLNLGESKVPVSLETFRQACDMKYFNKCGFSWKIWWIYGGWFPILQETIAELNFPDIKLTYFEIILKSFLDYSLSNKKDRQFL